MAWQGKPVRIGFVVSDLSNTRIGGISRVATEIGSSLVEQGHQVVAYVLHRQDFSCPAHYRGITIRYIEPFSTLNPDYPVLGFSRRAFRKFCQDAQNEHFDLLQSFNLNAIAYPTYRQSLKNCGIAFVVSSFETVLMDVKAKASEFRSLPSLKTIFQVIYETYLALVHERRYLRMADLVVTEDENTQAALQKMGIARKRIHLIPSGVDVENAARVSAPKLDIKKGAKGPVIGYIGRVDPRKGVQYLIAAMKLVRAKYPEAILFLAGGSRHGYDVTTRKLIKKLGLTDCVRLLGYIEGDIMPYYKLADVIAIPSLSEGIPITLGEAMAAEVPVVITRLPGVVPFIKPSDLVFWADIADTRSLSEAIIAVLNDSEKKDRLGRALRFIRGYTWRAVAESYLEVYREAVKIQAKLA